MKSLCKELYKYLQEELTACNRMGLTKKKEIECSYAIAEEYWKRLSEKLVGHEFKTKEDEISFFKECKPNFTAEIEYYNLLYHSVLFEPLEPSLAIPFWNREAARLEKFKNDNREFYNYQLLGKTEHDEKYFLRANYDELPGEERSGETLMQMSTNGDRLIANLKALEKYNTYAIRKLSKLQEMQ